MTPFLQMAGWTLIHFVWQGCAIAAVAAAALRLAERRSPNVRYVIACVGLAAMLAAPAATARLLWASDAAVFSATDGRQTPPDSGSARPDSGSARLQPSGDMHLPSARFSTSALERVVPGSPSRG